MADTWEHLLVPLAAGEDFSADDLARRPPALDGARNWVLDRPGGLHPRPGFAEHLGRWGRRANQEVQDNETYSASFIGAGALPSGTAPRSLVAIRGPLGETPALLGDGRAWVLGDADWHDAHAFWSTSLRRLADWESTPVTDSGDDLASASLVGPAGTGVLLTDKLFVLGADGQVIGQATPGTSVTGEPSRCVARIGNSPALYWVSGANLIQGILDTAAVPQVTETTAATNVGADSGQAVWADWDPGTSQVFLAFSTTTANQVRVERRTSTGVLTSSVTFSTPAAVRSVCVAVVDGRVVVAASHDSSGGNEVLTKVYSTSLVDQSIDVAFAATGAGHGERVVVGPGRTTNEAVLAWHDSTDSTLDVAQRSTTAATGAVIDAILGNKGAASAPRVLWRAKFAPFRTPSATYRCLLGVSWGGGNPSRDWTWALLDVGPVTTGKIVNWAAAGPINGSTQPAAPVPADAWKTSGAAALLGSCEFFDFDSSGGASWARAGYLLSFSKQVPAEEALGAWYFGGSVPHQYDGAVFAEAQFVGGPRISAAAVLGGGSLAAGSYTLAALWRWTDALGRVHRSVAAGPVTVTAMLNDRIDAVVVNYQFSPRYALGRGVQIELYAAGPNPAAGQDLTLQSTSNCSASPTATVQLAAVSTTGERLYTGGGILDNNPPARGAAGGLASAGGRLWAAGGRVVTASKFLKEGSAVSWNDLLEVPLPAGSGEVVALASEGDRVVALCERGAYLLGGPGFDDAGRGPGFSEPVRLSDAGCSGARAWCRTPVGLVFHSPDRQVLLLTGSGATRVSAAVEGSGPLLAAPAHLVHWPKQEAVVVFQAENADGVTGPVLLWYYRTGQWVRWEDGDQDLVGSSGALVDGVPWMLDAENSRVGSFTGAVGSDVTSAGSVSYTSEFTTPAVRISGGRLRGTGRCATVALAGRPLVVNTTVTGSLTVFHDDATENNGDGAVQVMAFTVRRDSPMSASQTAWPVARMLPEFNLSRRRCSTVRTRVAFTPGVVAVTELELDVQTTADAAPPAPGQRF